jgi:hypothetical protein
MRKISLLFVSLLLLISAAAAALIMTSPADRLVTFQDTVMLKGNAEGQQRIMVNGQTVKVDPTAPFLCGLVLHLGKNYVVADSQPLRLLRLKNFPDIEQLFNGKKHWAHDQIVQLATLGIIEGYPDDNFYPANPITRGEFATWLARLKKLPLPELKADVFFDVPKEHWRAPFIKAVVDNGYMKGYPDNTFGIDEPISRREAANVAVVSEGLTMAERIKTAFLDVPEEESGSAQIYVAREKGLVVGITEDVSIFDPDRTLTRAEGAVLFSRFPQSLAAVRELYNFENGYTAAEYCRLNVPADITYFQAQPDSVKASDTTMVRLRVAIASRESFAPVSKVKVDLSAVGGLPDAELFDDGTHGDDQKDDLIYSLNVSLAQPDPGTKILTATVIDRLGWESKKSVSLLVSE